VNLVTSVNVDSERAKEERKAILEMVRETPGPFYRERKSASFAGAMVPSRFWKIDPSCPLARWFTSPRGRGLPPLITA
jgi:hypothetical protein